MLRVRVGRFLEHSHSNQAAKLVLLDTNQPAWRYTLVRALYPSALLPDDLTSRTHVYLWPDGDLIEDACA